MRWKHIRGWDCFTTLASPILSVVCSIETGGGTEPDAVLLSDVGMHGRDTRQK